MRAVGAATFWFPERPAVEPLRLREAPMLALAACFAAGILLARHWQPPALLASATGALALLSIVGLRTRLRVATVAVFATAIAVGCWCAQVQPPPSRQESLRPYADGLVREIRGEVTRVQRLQSRGPTVEAQAGTDPWAIEPGGWQHERGDVTESVDLQLRAIEDVTPETSTMRPTDGGVRLTIIGAPPALRCGESISVPVRLRIADSYRDPGAYSSADALLASGISTLASAKAAAIHDEGTERASWSCKLRAAQTWAAERLERFIASPLNAKLARPFRLTETDAAILTAMLFGDRSRLSASLKQGFERTGTFHLFVVSGLHVSLLAGMLLWLLARLRVRETYASLITLPVITGYALLTGFGAPVQRALLMTGAFLLARLLARETTALNALGFAALAVLAADPRALFEAGFQMTFLVIFAAAGLASPLRKRLYGAYADTLHSMAVVDIDIALHPRIAAFRVQVRAWQAISEALFGKAFCGLPVWVLRFVFASCDALLFGVAIEVCMVLPLAVYFHRAVLLGLPTNAVCIPLAAALLLLALATFLCSLAALWAALPFAVLTALSLHAVRWAVEHASRAAPADLRVPGSAPTALALACVALALALFGVRAQRRLVASGALAAMLLAPLLVLWPARPLLHGGLLEVTAIDVGQGDSLLIASPEGSTMLIDAGGPVGGLAGARNWDIGEQIVAPYLWSRRIARLDVLVLTHAHSDHIGGMPAVLRDLRPRELWLGVAPAESAALRALLAEAAAQRVRVRWMRAGDAFAWGGLDARVLAPEREYANPGDAVNDDSLVLRLAYGRSSVLLEGDAEAPSENAMLQHGRVAPVTLLKVGHHGSRTSSTDPFVAAAQPKAAVISVGRHNTFGHPRFEVLDRLEATGTRVFRTDQDGAETFLLDDAGHVTGTSPAAP